MFKLPFLNTQTKELDISPEDNLLAIDIGTEMMKVLRFNVTELGVNVQKLSHIQQQQMAMSKGKIQNLDRVMENCRLAIDQVTDDIPENELPRYAVLGIAGEFIQGVSIVVNYEREEKYDEDVTSREEDQIIAKVHDQIIEGGKEDLAMRTGLLNEDIEILHITVTGMEIGGMNVSSLAGFRGKNVKLYFYASFAPKTYVEAIKKVTTNVGVTPLGIVAQPFAVARAYAGARNKDFSGIFIDIGGGTSDVSIVQHGNVVDTQMFAFGGRVFTKEIAATMNLDYRHAESRKLKYSKGELDKKVHNEVKDITYETAKYWMKTLHASLEMVEDIEAFPGQIFLCGGGAMLPDIRNVMLEFPWTQLLPFSSIPKINIFLPERLYGITDQTGELIHSYDVTPASLARFAHDKLNNPENYYYDLK